MGGGNGLKVNNSNYNCTIIIIFKSHMAQQRNQAKKENEKSGGGGQKGIAERTESKIGISCAICKTTFQSIKMKQQLKGIFFDDCYHSSTSLSSSLSTW